MAITKDSGRQWPLVAMVDFALADVVAGTATAAVELPQGAIVLSADLYVTEAFNGGTTATIKIGDAADDDRYTPTPLNVTTTGKKALTPTGYAMSVQGDMKVTFAQTGTAATTGAAKLIVQYAVVDRCNSNQG
jgi:hypothetical protein